MYMHVVLFIAVLNFDKVWMVWKLNNDVIFVTGKSTRSLWNAKIWSKMYKQEDKQNGS